MPDVVLVSRAPTLAARVGEAFAGTDLRLLATLTPDELGGAEAPEAVVVAGPLRAREGSDLREVRARLGETPLVACAPPADARAVRWAVDHGADGVVWETLLERALVPTLHAVCAGQLVVPIEARRHVQPPELTTREKQVLSLVVMGLSNGEIAGKLYLTESTVKSHLGTAFRKLGVRSRAEAARLVADPERGFGTGILAITGPVLSSSRRRPG
jgi:DNA-binding NarL/FixJ family response regulator